MIALRHPNRVRRAARPRDCAGWTNGAARLPVQRRIDASLVDHDAEHTLGWNLAYDTYYTFYDDGIEGYDYPAGVHDRGPTPLTIRLGDMVG